MSDYGFHPYCIIFEEFMHNLRSGNVNHLRSMIDNFESACPLNHRTGYHLVYRSSELTETQMRALAVHEPLTSMM